MYRYLGPNTISVPDQISGCVVIRLEDVERVKKEGKQRKKREFVNLA